MVAFTIIGVLLGGYGSIRARAIAQRTAIEKLSSHPVDNLYDFELSSLLGGQNTMLLSQPEHWLTEWFEIDFVHDIALSNFRFRADAESLRQLKHFLKLKTLNLKHGISNQSSWDVVVGLRQIETLDYPVSNLGGNAIQMTDLDQLINLRELVLRGGNLDRPIIVEMAKCPNLKTLRCFSINIQPGDELELPQLKSVEEFYWRPYFEPMKDDEFEIVRRMPNLKRFAFTGNKRLTDSVFAVFENATEIESLSFHSTLITGEEVHCLASLPKLRKLELGASQLNDAALKSIAEFSQLTHLEIGSSNVTDAGMPFIAELANLQHLSIRDTSVSDVGFQHLSALPNLRRLQIRDTNISSAAASKFKQLHPNCIVEIGTGGQTKVQHSP